VPIYNETKEGEAMAGADNLRVPTSEEARANGRKGGLASAESRRKKKAMRETLETLLSMPIKDGDAVDLEEIENLTGIQTANVRAQEAMLYKLILKAIKKGDWKAIELVWKIKGENFDRPDTTDNDQVLEFIQAMRGDNDDGNSDE